MHTSGGTKGVAAFAANSNSSEDALTNMVVLAVVTGCLTHIDLCFIKSGLIDEGFVSCFGDCPFLLRNGDFLL